MKETREYEIDVNEALLPESLSEDTGLAEAVEDIFGEDDIPY